MKASRMLIATLKEAPNEAVISSHILLIRAGMMRKLVASLSVAINILLAFILIPSFILIFLICYIIPYLRQNCKE